MNWRQIASRLGRLFLCSLVFGISFLAASGAPGAGSLLSHEMKDGTLRLKYERGYAEVEMVNGGTVHWVFAFAPALPARHSYAVSERMKDPAGRITEAEGQLRLSIPGGEVHVARRGMRLDVFQSDRLLFSGEAELDPSGGKVQVRMKEAGARYFGLGCKTGPMELTGRAFVNYNTDAYGYSAKSDPIYTSIPFYFVIRPEASCGVFVDSPARTEFDFSKSQCTFTVHEPWAEAYVFPRAVKQIVADYTRLTGRPYLPPMWAFGFHQSRYSYMNTDEVMNVAEGFRAADLPLDAIHLDIDFLDRNRSFTHDAKAFPDPLAMNQKLAKLGIRTVVIADPAIPRDESDPVFQSGQRAGVFLRKDGHDYEGKVWPGLSVFPDFTLPKIVEWWGPLYENALKMGISGFWNDMNEPAIFNELKTMDPAVEMDHHGLRAPHGSLHNAYGIAMARATHEGLERLRPDQRVFLLSRAGYAGIQRYAFLWSGDNSAAWDHLRMNVTMAASMGLCGAPYFGSDIGGYVGNPTGELLARWIQAGTFMPFMRDHTGKGNTAHEPYAFPAELPSIRKYLKLRYALMPYLYTAAWRSTTEGEPINRPLFYDFGPAYLGVDQGFLFGRDLLVFPVLKAGARAVEVVFPEGIWYDLFDRKVHGEGKETVPSTASDIPVYVRGGCILPMASHPVWNTDDLRAHRDLQLGVYPDRSGKAEGFLYEDDGLNRDYQKGFSLRSSFFAQVRGEFLEFTLHQEGAFRVERRIDLDLPPGIRNLRFNGKNYPVKGGRVRIES